MGCDGLKSGFGEDFRGRAGQVKLVADVAEDLVFVHGLHLVVNDDPLCEGLGLVEPQPGGEEGQARDDEHERTFGVHGEVEDHGQVHEKVSPGQVHLVKDEDRRNPFLCVKVLYCPLDLAEQVALAVKRSSPRPAARLLYMSMVVPEESGRYMTL